VTDFERIAVVLLFLTFGAASFLIGYALSAVLKGCP
jgi:hypothetical protein